MPIDQFLAAAQFPEDPKGFPIVLISDTIGPAGLRRLSEGVIDDILPAATPDAFWQVRIDAALRIHRAARKLAQKRESAAMNGQAAANSEFDRLTGVYNRDAILSQLFRETDRIQRMSGSLCMVLFDVDDFGRWNSRLGGEACDWLLVEIASRTARLLRSYDLLGRAGSDELLIAMPGCSSTNAVSACGAAAHRRVLDSLSGRG